MLGLHAEPCRLPCCLWYSSAIDGTCQPAIGIGAIYRTITGDRRVPDYGLHGVLRVLLCGINGTQDLIVQRTGKAAATVARTMLQPILDEARLAAKTCTHAILNNEKANNKGKVRMECAAAVHFMRNKGWEKVIEACLQHPIVRQHQVGGKSWESVCKTWWESFASMSVFAWRSAWFTRADFGRLRGHSLAMGIPHNELQWGKLLWTHLWIDHMYFFLQRSGESCQSSLALPWRGSHWRLKRMSRNSGGLSLLRGRLGVQVVVDKHTIDDSLAAHVVGYHEEGTTWARAHQCTKVRGPYKTTASNRHAAPSDLREAVSTPQEKDMKMHHGQGPKLPVGWGACRCARGA